jgi:hypothetical protein
MENLKEVITLTIKGHKFEVRFPNTGQLIDLEQWISRLSMPSNTGASLWAYNLAIAITTFRTLLPQLEEKLNVESFEKLSVGESSELVKVYLKEFRPWFDQWIDETSSIFEDA